MMVTEIQELRCLRTRRNSSSWSSSCSWKDFEGNESIHQYTSLQDILDVSTPRSFCFCFHETNELDPSNVAIKNVLVRRAASVYLQSSALLVPRNHHCLPAFCDQLKSRAAASVFSRRRLSAIVNPIKACLRPFLCFIRCLLRNFRSLTQS